MHQSAQDPEWSKAVPDSHQFPPTTIPHAHTVSVELTDLAQMPVASRPCVGSTTPLLLRLSHCVRNSKTYWPQGNILAIRSIPSHLCAISCAILRHKLR